MPCRLHDRPRLLPGTGRHPRARADARGRWATVAALAAISASTPALAVDYNLSAFGTVGWSQSNADFKYQRYIDEDGGFERDTLAGAQVDVAFTPNFGATLQGRLAPSTHQDNRWDAKFSWAFLSWRPDNNWLLRAGKLRVPLYLNSENTDVGATFTWARLPTEMYSPALTPTTDFTGAAAGYTRALGDGEFAADLYWGKANVPYRVWVRDAIPGVQTPHAVFTTAEVEAFGLALTWRRDEDALRLGLHQALARTHDAANPLIDQFPFVEGVPGTGVGYYQTSGLLPGPGVVQAGTIRNSILTLGVSMGLPAGLRFNGELAKRMVSGSRVAPEGTGFYLSLERPFGDWTPYVGYGQLRSSKRLREYYGAVNGNAVAPVVPNAALINAAQRGGADGIGAYDQWSWSLGTAWKIRPGQALKLEFQQVRTQAVSALIDAPSGEDSGRRRLDVWSLNYSFVF